MSDLWRDATTEEINDATEGHGPAKWVWAVPVEPDYEVTYCPVHDVAWPVNHERCGLIVLAHYPEVGDG